jgi:hypothetical protein
MHRAVSARGFISGRYLIAGGGGTLLTMGPLKDPVLDTDAANKFYVDQHSSIAPNFDPPLQWDPVTQTVSIDEASGTSSGTVSIGPQTLAGDKTFSGVPRAATQTAGDSSTVLATTEFVQVAGRGSNYEPSNGRTICVTPLKSVTATQIRTQRNLGTPFHKSHI